MKTYTFYKQEGETPTITLVSEVGRLDIKFDKYRIEYEFTASNGRSSWDSFSVDSEDTAGLRDILAKFMSEGGE